VSKDKEIAQLRAALRTAVADYLWSEGCSCCRGGDHDEHRAALGKLLKVPAKDGFHNFNKYRTKP
jgi:hypothetical protein